MNRGQRGVVTASEERCETHGESRGENTEGKNSEREAVGKVKQDDGRDDSPTVHGRVRVG